jgi:hypothetical protein
VFACTRAPCRPPDVDLVYQIKKIQIRAHRSDTTAMNTTEICESIPITEQLCGRPSLLLALLWSTPGEIRNHGIYIAQACFRGGSQRP